MKAHLGALKHTWMHLGARKHTKKPVCTALPNSTKHTKKLVCTALPNSASLCLVRGGGKQEMGEDDAPRGRIEKEGERERELTFDLLVVMAALCVAYCIGSCVCAVEQKCI